MWTVPSRIIGALAIPLVMVLIAGCGGMSEDEARREVHERVDKLSERIGTNRTVHGDGPAGMVPDALTLNYSYTVRVDVDPKEALDELRGPITEEMRDNGWSVSEKPKHNGVAYGHEDGRAFAITVSFKHDYVTITGETPFDNSESLRPFVGLWPFFYDFRATAPHKSPNGAARLSVLFVHAVADT